MYVIRSDKRNAYLTYEGWTSINKGVLSSLHNVIRFTSSEVELNKLPDGQRFVYFPVRRWRDM